MICIVNDDMFFIYFQFISWLGVKVTLSLYIMLLTLVGHYQSNINILREYLMAIHIPRYHGSLTNFNLHGNKHLVIMQFY